MDIHRATDEYEQWLGKQLAGKLETGAIKDKHKAMREDEFPFLRATFYRWAQLWLDRAGELGEATPILCVGDLHVENFGTWRDAEGRLVWGVNDFDEAAQLPWTSDLVRLGTSAAIMLGNLEAGGMVGQSLEAILRGYSEAMERPEVAEPFVLEERHGAVNMLARLALDPADEFWREFIDEKTKAAGPLPASARAALESALPEKAVELRLLRSKDAKGLGSLGRPRFQALARWNGGWIARETKALVPSAVRWALGDPTLEIEIGSLLATARRSPDPWFDFRGSWLVRRLAPDAVKIKLKALVKSPDAVPLKELFQAMGAETANIHLGSGAVQQIAGELRAYPKGWFEVAVDDWVKIVRRDYVDYKVVA